MFGYSGPATQRPTSKANPQPPKPSPKPETPPHKKRAGQETAAADELWPPPRQSPSFARAHRPARLDRGSGYQVTVREAVVSGVVGAAFIP